MSGGLSSRPRTPGWIRLEVSKKQLVVVFLLLATAFSIRILTFNFMRMHLHDPAWFQTGSYAKFDKQARDILSGQRDFFVIRDPTRTDLAQYPPAFPWFIAAVYKLTGNYSAYAVQVVTWLIDSFVTLVFIIGIAATAFGWRVGIASGFMAALSPVLAMYGAWPSADPPTTWFVLAANWALLVAAKRKSVWFAIGAGLLLGMACWFRVNPLYLAPAWAFAIFVLVRTSWQSRLKISAAVLFGTTLIIAPIVVRNYLSFPDFTPTGGTIGVNFWEGLGETELGRKNGFLFGDDKLNERERIKMGLPPDFPIEVQWPDGIRRDRERVRESLAFIKQHPVWYAGVMLKRMWGMLKVAGEPLPYYGSTGINVTSRKSLSPPWQGGVIALVVNFLGMVQSVVRHLFLPLTVFGVYVASRWDRTATGVIGVTILYYLVPGSVAHTEIRYVLPMHGLLTIFAGVAFSWMICRLHAWRRNSALSE